MNINYIILFLVIFLVLFAVYGSFKSISKIKSEKKDRIIRLQKYGKVVKPYISEDLEEPIKKKYNELDDNELKEIDMVWKICFPKLNGKTSSEKGFSNDSIIWILKDVKKKEIKGFISGLESIELIKFLNSKGIEDLDLYSIRNWNGIFINNLCILPEYRKKGWGNKLLKEIINWSFDEKKDYLHLLLDADNKPAYNLYKKNKFQIDKESNNSVTNKEVYTMLRLINSNKVII